MANTNTTVKIEAIKTDRDGCKMLAYSFVTNFSKCKPQVSPCHFADYKDGVLRYFEGSSMQEVIVAGFKQALQHIRARSGINN